MIAYLRGQIKYKTDRYLIIEINGLGYQVFTTEALLHSVKIEQTLELYTHQHVKEDILDLYGFATPEELNFFEKLISVSGVGPKSGLAVLSIAKLSDIKKAIAGGDPTLLKKVSGIGQKTAERIVVELKNKMDLLPDAASGATNDNDEVIAALEALGCVATEIRQALRKIPDDLTDAPSRVKAALKIINHQ